jgi:triacylglycerol esterase/lipase EstA (alpha/beta hydrolase family)
MNVNYDDTKRAKKIFVTAAIISIIALSPTLMTGTSFFERANAQAMCSDEYNTSSSPKSPNALPVILIHGYNEPPSVWSQWQHRLDADGIRFCTVSFSDDECGSALDHSHELSQIVQQVKSWTPHNKVNMVGHSKGGLDARKYLADSGTNDVANLIMIGTPNSGDPLANEVLSTPGLTFDFFNLACRPALDDLKIDADDTQVPANPHTDYHTIAGNWDPSSSHFCTFFWPFFDF